MATKRPYQLPAVTAFRSDDKIIVDSQTNGTGAMDKDLLLAITTGDAVNNLGLEVSDTITTDDGKFINSDNLWENNVSAHASVHQLAKGKYCAFRLTTQAVFAVVDSMSVLTNGMPDFSSDNFGRATRDACVPFFFEITDNAGAYLVSMYFGGVADSDLRIYRYSGDVSIPNATANGYPASNGKLTKQATSYTDIVKVSGGDSFKFTPKSGQSAIIGFLTSSKVDYDNVMPYSTKSTNRIVFSDVRVITAPSDAEYMLVTRAVIGTDVLPTYEKVDKVTIGCTLPKFVDAGLSGSAAMFVIPGQTTTDKTVNLSKDIFVTDYQYVSYSVTTNYSVMFIKMNRDFTDAGNSGWITGSGIYCVDTRYFRIYVKKTGGGTIKPTDGYSVTLGGASIPYGDGRELVLNPNGWAGDDEFIAGSDARCAIQVLSDVSYMNSKKLLLRNGVYELNSYVTYGTKKSCIVFSQELSERQYENEFHDRTIEGWVKPCGYEGDGVTIVKMSDTLYSSITTDAVSLFTTTQYSEDWATYFMTSYFKLKNLVIKVPNNQKNIIAVNLGTAEGGSQLEGLRIVGIPTNLNMAVESDRPAISPATASYGIISNVGATWNTNSYWHDIEVHGFGVGVRFAGMEHAFVHNLTTQWCTYGMQFVGGNQHPIVLEAIQDEHNVNLPDFGTKGGAITLLGYNASWPESCPTGYLERKRAIGNPIGRIEFTNNIESDGTISGNQDYPSLFEKGEGERCHVMNMNHKQIGTTAYRNSISPNVGQHYYDTDTEKEYICTGIEPSVWKEA